MYLFFQSLLFSNYYFAVSKISYVPFGFSLFLFPLLALSSLFFLAGSSCRHCLGKSYSLLLIGLYSFYIRNPYRPPQYLNKHKINALMFINYKLIITGLDKKTLCVHLNVETNLLHKLHFSYPETLESF